MPKAVIFDLDGCLVDSEPLSLACIADEMRALGLSDATAEEIGERFLGVSMSRIRDYVSARLKYECPAEFQTNVETRVFESYKTDLQTIPGAYRMLTELRRREVGLGLATGGSLLRMRTTLDMSGFSGFFNNTACSADEVVRGKPAPDLFVLVAARLALEPEHCIVLEDSPHGIKGAIAAGMQAIGFVGGSHLMGKQSEHAEILLQAGARMVLDSLDNAVEACLDGVPSSKKQ